MSLVTLATCSLNQWALDFQGNYERIRESILVAKQLGACYRLGPELEVCGYGCNDHFYESDTFDHSWEVVGKLLADRQLDGLLVDVGVPIVHKTVKYNCRIFLRDGKILLIRPKLFLANDGNYREGRWFTPWLRTRHVEEHALPTLIREITGQDTVPFGDAVVAALDTRLAPEICEELFTPQSPHVPLGLDGVEIFTNGSASHHELRKLQRRVDLLRMAMSKTGGIYLYANQQGCDGERMYYDGCALIVCNGKVVAQGLQFSLDDVEVVTATLDLDDIRSYRGACISRGMQATLATPYPQIDYPYSLSQTVGHNFRTHPPMEPVFLSPEQEISLGPACWLWDYLRRSNMKGFLLPLSGGIDSCASALIVHSMCRLVVEKAKKGDRAVIADARKVAGEHPETSSYVPLDPKEFANRIFHTVYLRTEHSGVETRQRSKELAAQIGSYHLDCDMQSLVENILRFFQTVTGRTPSYKVHGGTSAENLALQNVQARLRMLLGYMLAQLLPWCRGRSGSLLVLGSANVDECLRGYFTNKTDLKKFVVYCKTAFDMEILEDFLNAKPTAELEPRTATYVQEDETDMGFTYEELSMFGRLRKISRCGPVGMFQKLLGLWGRRLSPVEIADKVKSFFYYYAIHRHKMTTLTPSYHAESYSADDNRFDMRPFLMDARWVWQFTRIDGILQEYRKHMQSGGTKEELQVQTTTGLGGMSTAATSPHTPKLLNA